MPPEPSESPETISDLRGSLLAIEAMAQNGATPSELLPSIQLVHRGFTLDMPEFEPGLKIFRAVRVDSKPINKGRLSYPPAEYVRQNGRLNAAGEVLFYGALFEPSNALYECRAQVGERFAVGCWTTTQKLLFNHLGYFGAGVNSLPIPRVPLWMKPATETTRNEILRSWQSDIFTKKIEEGGERFYNISIALAKFAMSELVPGNESPKELAGVLYPSIATQLYSDNVALKPHVVDSSLQLIKVFFVEIRSINAIEYTGCEELGRITFQILDLSLEHRRDGRIIWNGESTASSISPWGE